MQQVVTENTLLIDLIDWEKLTLKLKHIDMRILEIVYNETTISFKELLKKVSTYGYDERTILRKINLLKGLDLIKVYKDIFLVINSKRELEKNVFALCTLWDMRDRHVRKN